ncbi:50S ribosomal protein L18 [Patescibacteria group bacterium]|nr:50S ribosomal protein L18 [Patescibacteria group bacterium]
MAKASKQLQRQRRHKRVRAKIKGTSQCPRFCVFRSNKYIYVQLIDDQKNRTLAAANSQEIKTKTKKLNKVAVAFETGRLVTKRALKKKIKKVVFDRGGYKYHGRVKAVAEGARKEGLQL